jgi:CheY-like chemotaxis protein
MPRAAADPRRIIVVDDDVDIRESIGEVLSESGYHVALAANGREALDELGRAPACALLLDLMMPVMDGWELMMELRRSPQHAALPVIVVSADVNVREKATTLAADAWLRKPINIVDLLAVLERYCSPAAT